MAGVFFLACIGVGIFLYSRVHDRPPVRYRSIITVQVAPGSGKPEKSKSASNRSTTTAPPIVSTSPATKLALAKSTRAAALHDAGVPVNTRGISWAAGLLPDNHFIALTVTAPTKALTNKVASGWGNAFAVARKKASTASLMKQRGNIYRSIVNYRAELLSVDLRLAKLLPRLYGGVQKFDRKFGNGSASSSPSSSSVADPANPPVPDNASPFILKLVFERPKLLEQITQLADKSAELAQIQVTPDAFSQVVSTSRAASITQTRQTALPAAAGLLGGLLLGVGLAVAIDRRDRRIRDPRAAAAAFAAPVLSLVPSSTDSDYVILSDPLSNVAEAYRGLAATSIATDRLPKAIMVSTPSGDAHEEVAANYAAALSRFGLKVALIATSPEQAWYADRFDSRPSGTSGSSEVATTHHGSTFPELLAAAHAGTLNGQLREGLSTDERAPNLVVVPPSDEVPAQLPVDGLPPLLLALADAGIDIVVVSGPALLEDADATIVAWATRCVLWAIVEGEITSTEARAAAARLELAGVVPFGVVMVGNRLNGV